MQLRGQEREQRGGVGEDHGRQVHQVRPEELRAPPGVVQALRYPVQPGRRAVFAVPRRAGLPGHGREQRIKLPAGSRTRRARFPGLRREQRPEPGQQDEGHGEAERVEGVDQLRPRPGGQCAAQRGPGQQAGVAGHAQQGGGGGELVAGHGPRYRRVERGTLQGSERGHRGGQHVQRPDRGVRQQRVDQQQRGQHSQPRLAPPEQQAAVEPVREHPAVQPEHHQRDKLGHAEQAHREH